MASRKDNIAARRRRVEHLAQSGLSLRAIAYELDITHPTVLRDLEWIEKETGKPARPISIDGADGRMHYTRQTFRDYETEDWFDPTPPGQEQAETAGQPTVADLLTDTEGALQLVQDMLRAEGVRQDLKEQLARIRAEVTNVNRTNAALPKPSA